jgi:RNA polymerase sigma-70 factor, ECF subfamily
VETHSERVIMGIVDRAARERHETAGWGGLVRRFAPYVHAVVVRAYRLPEPEAQDVFHEVFARTWERMDELRDDGALRACIATLARELAQEAPQKLAGDLDPPPTAMLRELDNALAVREAILHLPPMQREVVTRCCVDGQDHATIARALGVSVDAVATHLKRARRRLGEVVQHDASDVTPRTPRC